MDDGNDEESSKNHSIRLMDLVFKQQPSFTITKQETHMVSVRLTWAPCPVKEEEWSRSVLVPWACTGLPLALTVWLEAQQAWSSYSSWCPSLLMVLIVWLTYNNRKPNCYRPCNSHSTSNHHNSDSDTFVDIEPKCMTKIKKWNKNHLMSCFLVVVYKSK